VVHFITSTEQGVAEIPPALQGDNAPIAVILGGGYDDEAAAAMRKAVEGAGKKIPWLRPDMTKPGPGQVGPNYAQVVGQRAKDALSSVSPDSDVILY
jgi:hypothetical protein